MTYNTVFRPFFKNVFVVLQCRSSHWIGRLLGTFSGSYSTGSDQNEFANIAALDQTSL